ncbi:helix-turn-helix domain-containing protein [Umezawaea sp. NPDC059074]|uniref:helix-turn-helix domain-containing protein n=1 Tax=Umezawaea sp. NPDC059074 TaxID=3346716 RepID=UPI0036CC2B9F
MREIGQEIRLARQRSNIKATRACEEFGWSASKLSKIEKGFRRPSSWDVARLLGLCSVGPETEGTLRALVEEFDAGYFVRRHGNRLPEALTVVAMHEAMATAVTTYAPVVVPSLAQSADYARALLNDELEAGADVDAAVESRMARRNRLLYGVTAPCVVVYLGEMALSGVVGSAAVMHDQLTALAMMVSRGVITLRIIPRSASLSRLGQGGSQLEFRRFPSVVYAEIDCLTVVYDDVDLVNRWRTKESRLDEVALTASDSLDLLLYWVDHYGRLSTSVAPPAPAAAGSDDARS